MVYMLLCSLFTQTFTHPFYSHVTSTVRGIFDEVRRFHLSFFHDLNKNNCVLAALERSSPNFSSIRQRDYVCSLLHLIRVIARAHASTLATNLMCVKNSVRYLCL